LAGASGDDEVDRSRGNSPFGVFGDVSIVFYVRVVMGKYGAWERLNLGEACGFPSEWFPSESRGLDAAEAG
jgi:hypothetical protein